MGLLDSNAVRQYTKQGVFSNITTSNNGYLASAIDVKGYDTIRFRVTDANNKLSVSQYIQVKGALFNRNYSNILQFSSVTNQNSLISRVTANGEYICSELSLADNIQFYIVGSEAYDLTIEYTLCNSKAIERLLLNATNNINLKRELLLGQTSFSCDATGNHSFDITPIAANLDSRYVGIKFHLTFSTPDDNVALYIDAPLGDNSQSPRTSRIKLIDENGNFVLDIKDGTSQQNCFYFTDVIKNRYNIRCNVAGASGLTVTVKCYAVTSLPSIAHIQEFASRTITATDTAQTSRLWLYDIMRHYKFYFVTVEAAEGVTVSGSLTKDYLAGEELDNVILEFEDTAKACSEWIPITFASRFTISANSITGNGDVTIKIFGVV